jgi:hypothetical protein
LLAAFSPEQAEGASMRRACFILSLLALVGCSYNSDKRAINGALIGGGAGAVAGALAGGGKGALIGGPVGAVGGAAVGALTTPHPSLSATR